MNKVLDEVTQSYSASYNTTSRKYILTFIKDEDEKSQFLPDDNGINSILYDGLDKYFHCQNHFESEESYLKPILKYHEECLLEDENFLK